MAEAKEIADGILSGAVSVKLEPGQYLIFVDPNRVDMEQIRSGDLDIPEGFFGKLIPAMPPVGGKVSDLVCVLPSRETIIREAREECARIASDMAAPDVAARIRAL